MVIENWKFYKVWFNCIKEGGWSDQNGTEFKKKSTWDASEKKSVPMNWKNSCVLTEHCGLRVSDYTMHCVSYANRILGLFINENLDLHWNLALGTII